MASQVYYLPLKPSSGKISPAQVKRLLAHFPLSAIAGQGDLVAVKIHFGEKGNEAYIPPSLVRPVVEELRSLKAKPFLTDANTLYVGTRSDSVSHLETAREHGYSLETMGCPVLIADGLRGDAYVEVEINGQLLRKVKLAHELARADAIVCLTHFKGHELSGFGGSIKNLGMGGGCRGAKLTMHSDIAPQVKKERCIACGRCVANCPAGAIAVAGWARIDAKRCLGCGSCIVICPQQAVRNAWDTGPKRMQQKMVEHLAGFLKLRRGRLAFINFIINVSPICDCYGRTEPYIVPDIGICASLDPVAVDQASVDLVNRAPGLRNTALRKAFSPGSDKFRDIYPEVDWSLQLSYAEKMGLGSRQYRLIEL